MKTTLTIEPDVERLLQHAIRRTGKSMKAVVNDALRLGLRARTKSPGVRQFKVEPHAFGFKAGVDVDRLNQFADELETEETARRMAR